MRPPSGAGRYGGLGRLVISRRWDVPHSDEADRISALTRTQSTSEPTLVSSDTPVAHRLIPSAGTAADLHPTFSRARLARRCDGPRLRSGSGEDYVDGKSRRIHCADR